MAELDISGWKWAKSSRSQQNGSCVEVGVPASGLRARGVRDTKDQGAGPTLIFSAEEWTAFVEAIREGWFHN